MDEFDAMLKRFLQESEERQGIKRNQRTRSSSFRHDARKKRTQERIKVSRYGWKPSIGVDKGGYWVGAQNSNAQRYHKRQANKAVRRSGQVYQYCGYKKLYDYFWNWF